MEFLKNYLLTVKAILLSPKEFFEGITFDGGWKEPFIFFLLSASVFALALSTTATLFICAFAAAEPSLATELRQIGVPIYFMIYFGTCLLSSLIGSQVISALTTITLHFFGGKGTFQQTFTVLSCCWVVLLFNWIPIIGWLGGLYFFYLAYLGLAKAHDVPGWKGIVSLILGTGVLTCIVGGIILVSAITSFMSVMKQMGPDAGGMYEPSDPGMREIMERYRKKEEE